MQRAVRTQPPAHPFTSPLIKVCFLTYVSHSHLGMLVYDGFVFCLHSWLLEQ
jgi:hypothetical protein